MATPWGVTEKAERPGALKESLSSRHQEWGSRALPQCGSALHSLAYRANSMARGVVAWLVF